MLFHFEEEERCATPHYSAHNNGVYLSVYPICAELNRARVSVDNDSACLCLTLEFQPLELDTGWVVSAKVDQYAHKTGKVINRAMLTRTWSVAPIADSRDPLFDIAVHIAEHWGRWIEAVQYDESRVFPYSFADGKLYGIVKGVQLEAI